MEKKNISVHKTLILLVMVVAPSFYLFSSYSPRHIPAGKRPIGYRKGSPQRRRRSPQLVKSVPEEVISPQPAQMTQVNKELPQEDEMEEPSEPTASQSGEKDVQVASAPTPAPGMLTALYATIAPIILVTLNDSLGKGIGASTAGLVELAMKRRAFFELKNDLLVNVDKLFSPEDRNSPEYKKLSDTEKLEFAKTGMLSPKERIKFDMNEKATSLSAMLNQAAYIGIFRTIIPMIGSLFGLVTTMGLQKLMPSK